LIEHNHEKLKEIKEKEGDPNVRLASNSERFIYDLKVY